MTPWFFSESIDYLKILGNPWINWFLNFPYDINIYLFSFQKDENHGTRYAHTTSKEAKKGLSNCNNGRFAIWNYSENIRTSEHQGSFPMYGCEQKIKRNSSWPVFVEYNASDRLHILCQKHSFFHQLTQNMTTDCSAHNI